MIISAIELILSIKLYESNYKDEHEFCIRFLQLLKNPNCYLRTYLPGHITGSAWIIDETHKYTLLTHHAKLDKWLQPGGHADGNENITAVALLEANEETGLKNIQLLNHKIFDLDIHTIPARNDFPEHLHYDVRFIMQASRKEPLTITEESKDLQWVLLANLEKYTANQSIHRMKEKTISLAL